MRFEGLYVAGAASWLPPAQPVAEAVAAGVFTQRLAASTGVETVAVAGAESPPEMAARAVDRVLDATGVGSADLDLILYAATYYQGQDLWPPASYVQRVAVGNRCPAIEVRQMSNGGMAALELGAAFLSASAERGGVLLATGDKFAPPGFDRWLTDPGTVYGDGGTALVLSRRPGPLRLTCLATVADAELEGMHRGTDPFATEPFTVRRPVSLGACKDAFVADVGLSYCTTRLAAGQQEVLKRTLAEADLQLSDIDWFVLPHLGRRRLQQTYLRPLGIDPQRTTWSWSRTVGHLGAGDQIAGLAHLLNTGRLRPGQRCLLMGVGAGFVWTNAVLEVTS